MCAFCRSDTGVPGKVVAEEVFMSYDRGKTYFRCVHAFMEERWKPWNIFVTVHWSGRRHSHPESEFLVAMDLFVGIYIYTVSLCCILRSISQSHKPLATISLSLGSFSFFIIFETKASYSSTYTHSTPAPNETERYNHEYPEGDIPLF